MACFHNPVTLLVLLNDNLHIGIQQGEMLVTKLARGEKFSDRPQQLSLPFGKRKQFELNIQIDVFLQGMCSDLVMCHNADLERYPMGTCIHIMGEPKDAPKRSWLHEVLASEDMRNVRKIVVFPGCCGSYPNEYQRLIRRLFPEHEWFFVEIGDLYDNVLGHLDDLATALMKQGIIRIQ